MTPEVHSGAAKPRPPRVVMEAAKPKLIVVLTPTLGMFSANWHVAMTQMAYPMNWQRGFIPGRDVVGGQIGQVRNKLVDICFNLEKEKDVRIDYVMWLDDDVLVSKLCLLTLLAHEREVAAGVYFTKSDPAQPLIFPGPSAGTSPFLPDQCFDSWGYAQGLSVVKLDVYREIIAAGIVEKDEYGNWEFYKQPGLGFTPKGDLITGGTEDFHFFDLLNKIGVVPLVDCTKHAFGFHFDAREWTGYPVEQWRAWEKQEPVVWRTKDGDVTWT